MSLKAANATVAPPGFSIDTVSRFRWEKANVLHDSAAKRGSVQEKIPALERSARLLERNVRKLSSNMQELTAKEDLKDMATLSNLLGLVVELKRHYGQLESIYIELVSCYDKTGDVRRATISREKLASTLYTTIEITPPFLLEDGMGWLVANELKSEIPKIFEQIFKGYEELIAQPKKPEEPDEEHMLKKAKLMQDFCISHLRLAQMNDGWFGSREKAIEHAGLALDKLSEAMKLIKEAMGSTGDLSNSTQAKPAVELLSLFKAIWDWRERRADILTTMAISKSMEKQGVNPKGNTDFWAQFLGINPVANPGIQLMMLHGTTPEQVLSTLSKCSVN